MNHKTTIILSGAVWLVVGVYLLTLGLNLLAEGTETVNFIQNQYPLLESCSSFLGGVENAVIALIAASLFIGYFKGKFVLGKTAIKGVKRLRGLKTPIKIQEVYTPRYYILLGGMMLLGMSIKFLGLPHDIRGVIDVAVGSALINGAMVYFRHCFALQAA